MKNILKGLVNKPHLIKRLVLCLIAVILMGFGVSWLKFVNWGTDPCSLMNFAVAEKLGWSFGNWQALLNICLFIIVVWKGKDKIGFGTIFNMFLVGYACDFMTWLREKTMKDVTLDAFWMRLLVMLICLIVFVLAVAVYMSVDLGTAPYDALPYIIAESQSKLSFKWVRIIWDVTVTIIGLVIGGGIFAGNFGIVTVIMAFTIGPAAAWVEKRIKKYIE